MEAGCCDCHALLHGSMVPSRADELHEAVSMDDAGSSNRYVGSQHLTVIEQ